MRDDHGRPKEPSVPSPLTWDEAQLEAVRQVGLATSTTDEQRNNAALHLIIPVRYGGKAARTAWAERLLTTAAAIIDAATDPEPISEASYWLGDVLMSRGRPAEALPRLRAAQRTPDPRSRTVALHGMGTALLHLGNVDEAERVFKDVLASATERHDPEGQGQASLGLGQVARVRNEPGEAARWLAEAQRCAEEAGDASLSALVTVECGLLAAGEGEGGIASRAYDDVSSLLPATAEDPLDANLVGRAQSARLANQAALARRRGDIDRARTLIDAALAIENLPMSEQIENLHVAGDIEIESGGPERAARRYLAALELSERAGYLWGHYRAAGNLAMAYSLAACYEPAHRVCRQAIETFEDVRLSIGAEGGRRRFIEGRLDIYELIVNLSLVLWSQDRFSTYGQQAFAYVERAKSRTFIEALGVTTPLQTSDQIPADVLRAEAELRNHLLQARASETSTSDGADIVAALVGLERIWKQISEVAPEYAAMRFGESMTVAEIRALLGAPAPADDRAAPLRRPRPARIQSEQEEHAPAIEPTQVTTLFADGSSHVIEVPTRPTGLSYEEVLAALAQVQSLPELDSALTQHLVVFDAGWWDYLEQQVARLTDEGHSDDAERLVNTGVVISDKVLLLGEHDQLSQASRWRNQRLVSQLVTAIQLLEGAAEHEAAIYDVLADETDVAKVAAGLHALVAAWPDDVPWRQLAIFLECEGSWLDTHFFREVGTRLTNAQRQDDRSLAARCFLAGAIAAGVIAKSMIVTTQSPSGSFLEAFPEQRYLRSPGPSPS